MAAGVRTRKRQREEGVLDSVELTRESAPAFVDQMRDAVTQGTIEELIGAVQRAGPEGLRALVAKGGLRRFRQWLKELMDGGHVSVSPKRSVSVERAVLVDYVLQVLMTIPVKDPEDISRSGVAAVVGDIAENRYRVIASCAKSARALIEHWAQEHGLAEDDDIEVEEGDEPPAPATNDPRFVKPAGSVSPAQSGIATPASASSASGHDDDDDDDDDDDLDELPPMLQLDGDDAPIMPPGFESLDNLDAGLPLAEMLGKPADDAAEELQDHTFFDGRPEKFGKVPTGVLINRKEGVVGGRPWAPRKVALAAAGDAATAKADVPPEAIKAKEKRKRGIVFAEDMERVRFFLRRAVPTAVSVGNPTEEDFRKSMESDGDDFADDEDLTDAAGSDGNVEERRRREQEREKGLNLRDRLAHGDDEEAGELGAAGSKLAQSGAGFPPTHNHVPPPLVAIPAALQRKPVSTKDSLLNDAATAQAFEYHQRNPALAPRTPAVSESAWQGFQADKSVQQFRAPPLASAAHASPGLAPRRALGGLGGIVAKLTSSRGAVRDDARDASMSRRSASPGESLARSSSVPQAAGAPAPAAGILPVRSSLLSSLSGIMGRVSASQGAHAAVPAAAPRAPSIGASRPSPYAPSPSASSHHVPGAPTAPQPAVQPHAGPAPTGFPAPVSAAYGAARPVGTFQQHGAQAPPPHPSAGHGAPPAGGVPYAAPAPGGPVPPIGSYERAPYDNANWWHLLPEEMPPVTNRATRGSPCHFFPTIQGCQMGANCGFKHDPYWTPSRAPKGVDRLWPKFLYEILPRRRARRAAAGAAGAAGPHPQAGAGGAPAGPPPAAAAAPAGAAPPGHFSAHQPPPRPYGAAPAYGAPAAAGAPAGGGYAYGGAPAAAPAPSSGAPYTYGGAPAAAAHSAPRGYGGPGAYGGAAGAGGYAYGGGAGARPSAAPSQYQYGGSGPPAQRPAMAPQYGATAPAAGYQYGGRAPMAPGGGGSAGGGGGATLNPSAISQFYGSRN
ncbi:hypothetical protein FNF27_01616 [Cafeteria roenbergensis]|uniref:C3H1-type domain-containing protein n=1 Tax=Cafeteria roenbergensis TaxID=33653 RepID=A0A5A8EHR6_CAFRO|nr:hypothetical protein FNF27_01616 [Cafeteria roenbergensis]